MKTNTFKILMLAFIIASCSSGGEDILNVPEPEVPVVPNAETKSDSISLGIGVTVNYSTEAFTRAFSSNDLFAVVITQRVKEGDPNEVDLTHRSYAYGIFDNIADIKFNFVEGKKYVITMLYFPNAKNIVHNYADGTFGQPFKNIYAKPYKLNIPTYASGTAMGEHTDLNTHLRYIIERKGKPTTYDADMELMTERRYVGHIPELEITKNSNLSIEVKTCEIGLTFKVNNFFVGKLKVITSAYPSHSYEINSNPDTGIVEHQLIMQEIYEYNTIGGNFWNHYNNNNNGTGWHPTQVYYITESGSPRFLLTTNLPLGSGVNHVFEFKLGELTDGEIGIIVNDDSSLTDTQVPIY